MELFWLKGFDGASIAELTGAMGIASPSLYAAFGSKEGLFREAVARYLAQEGADIWQAVLTAGSAHAVIERFLMATATAFTLEGRPTGCFVVLSAINAGAASAEVRAELHAWRERNVTGLTQHLARGVAAGEIAADTDLEQVARFYVTVQQGMALQARDGASRAMLEAIAQSALAAWGPLTAGKTVPAGQ
jgi:AcrR family transcriptional regulator